MGCIFQLTTDLHHIKGWSNFLADALSCPQLVVVTSSFVGLPAVPVAESRDKSCARAPHSSSFQCRQVSLAILCGISTGSSRLLVLTTDRCLLFNKFHAPLNHGIVPGLRLVAGRYVWSTIKRMFVYGINSVQNVNHLKCTEKQLCPPVLALSLMLTLTTFTSILFGLLLHHTGISIYEDDASTT